MEAHAQSVEDNLIDSLQFNLRSGASYITDRRSVSYFTQGGNDYAPNGVKVIKVMMTGDAWLDPSTVKLFMDVTNTNTAANNITPIVEGGWGMFRRLRILCGGQIVEDIDNYNRLHEMFHMMKPSEKRDNDAIEGFGAKVALAQNKTRTICFTPMSGLLNQDKYLPIRYAPRQLEFEVVSSATDAFTGTTVAFKINNVQLKADLVSLDNGLDNQYSQHLLSGKTLPIHFSTFTHASQVITSIDSNVNVSRALTRLKAVFVSISNDDGGAKEVNNFWHPMGGVYDYDQELEFEMQIGSKKFPEYPMRSISEQFYQLRKALGVHGLNNQLDLTATTYNDTQFVMALDTEKVLGASFSGYNSKAGDLLTLKLKKQGVSATLAEGNSKLHYCLHHDSILSIGDSGCQILD